MRYIAFRAFFIAEPEALRANSGDATQTNFKFVNVCMAWRWKCSVWMFEIPLVSLK